MKAKSSKSVWIAGAALLALAPQNTLAQSSAMRGTTPATTTTTTTTTPTAGGGAAAPIAGGSGSGVSPASAYNGYGGGENMNSGAKSAKSQALMGAATNGATAGFWFSKCKPPKVWPCVLGGLHVVQAGMMLQGARGAGKTAAATQHGMPDGVDENGGGISDTQGADAGGPGEFDKQANQIQRDLNDLTGKLNQAGVKISPDGQKVTMPDGKIYPSAAFASRDGLKELGLSEAELNRYDAAKAALSAKIRDRMKALAAEEGGGSGAPFGSGAGSRRSGGGGFGFGDMFADKKVRQPATVKGLSKQLGNDRIGVAADDIFEMVSRQYQKEEGRQNFLQPAGLAPAPAPALGQ